ncbi:MAG: ABC transporter substrate-binding protein/permease [Lachnospiraceae bacterium]|nr:ABC transporter substrate-binding protein/permease [Lachnospiraceae bacterium]
MKGKISSGTILFVVIAAVFLSVFTFGDHIFAASEPITCKADLNKEGIRVGTGEGSAAALIIEKELPNAEIAYQEGNIGYESVAKGKLDAFIFDRRQMQLAIDNGRKGVRLLDENMDEKVHIAVGISPVSHIPDLQNVMNSFIKDLKADGTLDDMYERWVIERDENMPDIEVPENPEIHLQVGTSGILPPYTYYKGTELNGYDIELARRFASYINASLEFKVYDYAGIIPACASGDIDCIMANLNITPERAEALPFSDDLYEETIAIMVKDDSASGLPLLDQLKQGIEKNFIREDRWKLFVNGVIVTLEITILSILFGTVLGFILLLICKDGNRAANSITNFCLWLVQGMPIVVLLMILYYIVFGNLNLSGMIVSVICFTLVFGSAVYNLLKIGVGTVDRGQYEGGYALGFTNNETFFSIVLPQALPHVIDAYRIEITNLLKATAIVGYIAVQDLTKVGDIVRSRTYDAFFPLIAIAFIYFVLEGVFGLFVKGFKKLTDHTNRSKEDILKGIVISGRD